MKLQRLLAAVMTTALLLTGCTSLSLTGPDLLTPPLAVGDRAEIQDLIKEDAEGAYTLIAPTSGKYKSGVVLYDLDKNGKEEAIALYTTSQGTAHMLIAEYKDGSYQLYGSVQMNSTAVYRLDFADVNADGKDDLLIGSDAGTQLSNLYVYFADGDITKLNIAEGYVDYVAGDFDGDSAADALLFQPLDKDAVAKASLRVYANGKFEDKSTCEIDPAVISYAKISFGKINEDINAAIADGVLENGDYTTQTLYYDTAAQTMVNPLFVSSGYSDSVRSSKITSFDIDNDGIVEIPMCALMEHGKDEDVETVCSIAHWDTYDAAQMAPAFKQDSILCDKMGFMLNINADTADELTARYTDSNVMTVYSLTYKDGEPAAGDALLTIKRYNRSSFDAGQTDEADLYESTKSIYTYILHENSSFSHEDVKNNFVLIEDYL